MDFLLLGIDSLIAGLAVGALVAPRVRGWLAGFFGLADGLAFLIGVGLGVAFLSEAASEVVELGALVVLGVYLLVVAVSTGQLTARWAVWLLPIALTVDNLTFGLAAEHSGSVLGEALVQAASSAMLAYLGLYASVWLSRKLPGKLENTRIAGAALLLGAGALVLVG